MAYTKNQHVLSQWWLRNFRSDDTANALRDKKRVWCHTVYIDDIGKNKIKIMPLPISSIAIKKECFSLIDSLTGEKFEIEAELSIFEKKSSLLVNDLVKDHLFEKLLDTNGQTSPLNSLLHLMIIQSILNLHNPQNMSEEKEENQKFLIEDLVNNFDSIKDAINNPPVELKDIFDHQIYKKIVRVINSSSSKEDICKVLVILFLIASSEGLPTLGDKLSAIKNDLFNAVYIEGIYHTGYELESTEPRPVFCISPNIMAISDRVIFQPLAHNFAIAFSSKQRESFNREVSIFSPFPETLNITDKRFNKFKVSHDYIDCITAEVTFINNCMSNTIYTPHCVDQVNEYLKKQTKDYDYYYEPENPVLVS